MKSQKGQALLEFILIMPIMLLLLLAIIDFGRILYEKNQLENITSDVVDMFDANLSDTDIQNKVHDFYGNKITLTIEHRVDDTVIELSEGIDIYTPGLENILNDPYEIEVSRVIYNE